MLIWLLVPVVAALRRRGRAVFVAAVGVAIAIEGVGAFAYTGVTDAPIFAVASGPDQLRAAWEWRNAPFIASLSHGLAPAELLQPMRGAIDAVEVDGTRHETIVAARTSSPPAGRWRAAQRRCRWPSRSTAGSNRRPAPSSIAPTSAARCPARARPAGASRSRRPASHPASTGCRSTSGAPRRAETYLPGAAHADRASAAAATGPDLEDLDARSGRPRRGSASTSRRRATGSPPTRARRASSSRTRR